MRDTATALSVNANVAVVDNEVVERIVTTTTTTVFAFADVQKEPARVPAKQWDFLALVVSTGSRQMATVAAVGRRCRWNGMVELAAVDAHARLRRPPPPPTTR